MTKIPDKKKHADFQSKYRRSFNFRNEAKSSKLVLDENGELILRSENSAT